MSNKYYIVLVSLFCVIYLSACAERNIPQIYPEPTPGDSNIHTEAVKHAQAQEQVPAERPSAALDILGCLEADSLQPERVAKDIQKLQSSALAERTGQNHLVLACLLSRDSANDTQLAQAQALLEALAGDLSLEERLLVTLLKRKISLQLQLHQHQSKLSGLRAQNRELLDKIEQLKGLERDLDVTNIPIPEPTI